jgi:hypothetical protein
MVKIADSVRDYETWLRAQLGRELVEADLRAKHVEMKSGPFRFLRATCWRWAEIAPELLPGLAHAPSVLSVNDAHVENFGLWRDAEGRLVFGVNDFDEGAPAPYVFDLVRLAASALLAWPEGLAPTADDIADAVLDGYRAGLQSPRPLILDFSHRKLRGLLLPDDEEEVRYWRGMELLKAAVPPKRFASVLTKALPPVEKIHFAPRRAGAGSLGRMRFIALATHRGGPVAREAKALVPSCWAPTESKQDAATRLLALARGPYRSPDPWFNVTGDLIVRRMAPDSRKLNFDETVRRLSKRLLGAMAYELANIHRGDPASIAIAEDLGKRKKRWLEKAATATAKATLKDFKAFANG